MTKVNIQNNTKAVADVKIGEYFWADQENAGPGIFVRSWLGIISISNPRETWGMSESDTLFRDNRGFSNIRLIDEIVISTK